MSQTAGVEKAAKRRLYQERGLREQGLWGDKLGAKRQGRQEQREGGCEWKPERVLGRTCGMRGSILEGTGEPRQDFEQRRSMI